MEHRFAAALFDMVWPTLCLEVRPGEWAVHTGYGDGRFLGFFPEMVLLAREDVLTGAVTPLDGVILGLLANDQEQAQKLAEWLGSLFRGRSGVRMKGGQWTAWAVREDGAVFEVGCFGYRLFTSEEAMGEGVEQIAALRQPH